MKYRKMALVFKQNDYEAEKYAHIIAAWLQEQGMTAQIFESGVWGNDRQFDCELVIVLGGDGTILGVARKLAGTGIPFFGINFGRVGYLTAASRDDWHEKLARIINLCPAPDSALALRWQIWSDNMILRDGVAINEIVMGRGKLARLVSIRAQVNGHDLGVIRSDGLMISTPAGSTGYCASAGGPALFPCLESTIFLAICPFLNSHLPMVFPASFSYRLEPLPDSPQCWLTVDGQEGYKIEESSFLTVSAWEGAILFYGGKTRFFSHIQVRRQVENSDWIRSETNEV